jgi:hypothetical protein
MINPFVYLFLDAIQRDDEMPRSQVGPEAGKDRQLRVASAVEPICPAAKVTAVMVPDCTLST